MAKKLISDEALPAKAKKQTKAKKTPITVTIDADLLEKFKNYCYTERLKQSQAVEMALKKLLKGVKEEDLLKRPNEW